MKAKTISIIQIVYGLIGSMFGIFLLLIMPSIQIKNTPLHSLWLIYLPLMIFIGLIYIVSGFLLRKGKKEGILLAIFAAILNIVWYFTYVISLYKNVLPAMADSMYLIFDISMIYAGFLICGYPIFLLSHYLSNPKSQKKAFFYFALAFCLGIAFLFLGKGLFLTNVETASYGMKQIECELIPAQISDYSASESSKHQNNILLSTSFENLDILNPTKISPFLNDSDVKWKVHDVCCRSGKYCLNIIPNGNKSFGLFSYFLFLFGKDRDHAILNSRFSDSYKPFDISKFDFVELDFWSYSTSNPDKREDSNCGSSLDIYYRIDNGSWEHKMAFCGQHKSETSGWGHNKLKFVTKGHMTIEFKFVYNLRSVPKFKRDSEVFYLIDDLQLIGIVK